MNGELSGTNTMDDYESRRHAAYLPRGPLHVWTASNASLRPATAQFVSRRFAYAAGTPRGFTLERMN
jgi:hypothetical protein